MFIGYLIAMRFFTVSLPSLSPSNILSSYLYLTTTNHFIVYPPSHDHKPNIRFPLHILPDTDLLIPYSLNRDDRKTLERAASKLSTHITIGSLIGLGVGVALAWQIRSNRVKFFNAFKAMQRPTHVKFADGREGAFLTYFPPPTVPLSLLQLVTYPSPNPSSHTHIPHHILT